MQELQQETDEFHMEEFKALRAENYRLLALLFGKAPTEPVLTALQALQGDASPLGMTYIAMADAAARLNETQAGKEYFNLFVGLGRGDFLPYASYYLTGFLHERPLAKVREDMIRFGIERNDAMYEPEDHIAILCETMALLLETDEAQSEEFFTKHLKPWASRFFVELEMGKGAVFYRAVAAFGRAFMTIESESLALTN